MHKSLFWLGLLTAAAGFAAIGFGIPVHAFSFGNTLIIAGATAVAGGFVLIGLSAVVRELKRIADGNAFHGQSAAANAAADPFEAQASFLGSAKPDPGPRAAPAEPRIAAAQSAEPDSAIAWLRPKDGEPTLGERAVIEEFEASLAPQASQPSLVPQRPPVAAGSRAPEPKPWTPLGQSEPAPASRAGTPRPDRAQAGSFDTVWPARSAETVERARKAEPPRVAPDERATGGGQPPAAPTTEEPRPVAILKSGMIDGMAYTLYADGSIEAVLPTGPIRFASVEALRAHLEKSG
jgi:hypothetical protein